MMGYLMKKILDYDLHWILDFVITGYIIIVLITILVYLCSRKKKPESLAKKIIDMLKANKTNKDYFEKYRNKKDGESE